MKAQFGVLAVAGACLLGVPAAFAQSDPEAPAAVPAAPGVDKVEAGKPDWCEGYKPGAMPININFLRMDIERKGINVETFRKIARAACEKPEDPNRQRWIAAWRQAWLNVLQLSEKDNREAMKARVLDDEGYTASLGKVCDAIKPGEADPAPQAAFNRARMRAYGCFGELALQINGLRQEAAELGYWIDRRADAPDNVVRAVYFLQCINIPDQATGNIEEGKPFLMGNFALCQRDGRKLDKEQLEKELAGLALDPIAKAGARETFALAKRLYDAFVASYTALGQKDAAFKEFLLEAPEQAFAGWEKAYAANKAAVDAAQEFEDKFLLGSKKALKSCEGSLRKNLFEYVKAAKPKSPEDVKAALSTPVGYSLLSSLAVCDAFDGRPLQAKQEIGLMHKGRAFRGPRTAAYWAAADALDAVLEDRESFPVKRSGFLAQFPRSLNREGKDWIELAERETHKLMRSESKGLVESVTPAEGGGFKIVFKTVSWQEPVYDCKETNKVDRIEPDGRVVYRQNCVQKGTETVTSTAEPAIVPAELMAGIKPGVFLVLAIDRRPTPAAGFPQEVFSDETRKAQLAWFGFPLGE